jgi:hypothetical protein
MPQVGKLRHIERHPQARFRRLQEARDFPNSFIYRVITSFERNGTFNAYASS